MIENDDTKILWDFLLQADKMVVANQSDIIKVDKQEKKVVVVAIINPK